jgi:hypothetical protein
LVSLICWLLETQKALSWRVSRICLRVSRSFDGDSIPCVVFVQFQSVWKGEKPNRTEPKLIGLNRFSVRFGSKTKNKIKSVWLFILVQNRIGPKMLSLSYHHQWYMTHKTKKSNHTCIKWRHASWSHVLYWLVLLSSLMVHDPQNQEIKTHMY